MSDEEDIVLGSADDDNESMQSAFSDGNASELDASQSASFSFEEICKPTIHIVKWDGSKKTYVKQPDCVQFSASLMNAHGKSSAADAEQTTLIEPLFFDGNPPEGLYNAIGKNKDKANQSDRLGWLHVLKPCDSDNLADSEPVFTIASAQEQISLVKKTIKSVLADDDDTAVASALTNLIENKPLSPAITEALASEFPFLGKCDRTAIISLKRTTAKLSVKPVTSVVSKLTTISAGKASAGKEKEAPPAKQPASGSAAPLEAQPKPSAPKPSAPKPSAPKPSAPKPSAAPATAPVDTPSSGPPVKRRRFEVQITVSVPPSAVADVVDLAHRAWSDE